MFLFMFMFCCFHDELVVIIWRYDGLKIMRIIKFHFIFFLQAAMIFPLEILPSDPQSKTSGSDLTLTCSIPQHIKSTGVPHLDWWNPIGLRIEATEGRVHIERPSTSRVKLFISKLKISDSGSYRCTLAWGDVETENALLVQVSDETPLFDVEVDAWVEAGSGEDAMLRCGSLPPPPPPPSHPRNPVTWRFNDTPILPSKHKSRKYQVDKKGNLLVRRVAPEDGGLYECLTNQAASSRFVELKVLRAPGNVRIEIVGKMIEGRNLHVECLADGSDPLKFEWLKEQILSEKVRAKIPVVRQNSTLWLPQARDEHEGKYFCRVSNSRGTIESPMDVKLMRLPSINFFHQNQTIPEGAPMVVDCDSKGDPMPLVAWMRMNNNNFNNSNNSTASQSPLTLVAPQKYGSSKLVISKVEVKDEGDYLCISSNEAGNQSRLLSIDVERAPRVHCRPDTAYGWSGAVTAFRCIATGKPVPSIHWKRNGQSIDAVRGPYEVTSMNRSSEVESSLKITIGEGQSWLYGAYTCAVQNRHGTAYGELKLLLATLPSMPHNVSIISENGTCVTLKVAVGECRPAVSVWKIEYREKESNISETQSIVPNGADDSELTISGLRDGKEYLIFVAAGNEMGFSEPAVTLVTTSSQGEPQGSSQVQQLVEEENSSKMSFEILSGCFGAALFIICTLLLVYCLKKKRPFGRGNRSALSSGIRCYSWYNATTTAKLKTKTESLQDDKVGQMQCDDSRKAYASPELIHATLDDRETSLTLLRTTSRRNASLKYSHTDVTLSPEKVSIRTGTSALDYDITDTCSGVYEEIPKSDSTAVSEILDEYHVESNGGESFLVQRV